MKRYWIILVLSCLIFSSAAALYLYHVHAQPAATAQSARVLSADMPEGALLYVEARDFAGLLQEWNASPEKRAWVKSQSYAVFSNSHLFLRLKAALEKSSTAAGLPLDEKLVNEAAGGRSALAIYNIGDLEMLYITELPSARSMQSALWQMHSSFEQRSIGAQPFFVGKDPNSGHVVAFAITNRYLVVGTKEELVANALHLMAGEKLNNLEEEDWFQAAHNLAGEAGDLRMVLNLGGIATTPQFRSYWIQQNITEMQGYSTAVVNLYRSGNEYREERVLLREPDAKIPNDIPHDAITPEGEQAVADLLANLPADYGVYRVLANPKAEYCSSVITGKILSPHIDVSSDHKTAPAVAVIDEGPGSASDLETRIDADPSNTEETIESYPPEALVKFLRKSAPLAMLSVQSTRTNADGAMLGIRTGFVLASNVEWDGQAVRSTLQAAIRPGATASILGLEWKQAGERSNRFELDGLIPLIVAVQGKKLFVANNAEIIDAMLQGTAAQKYEPAIYAAGFRHDRERENFAHLTHILDTSSVLSANGSSAAAPEGEPGFFSGNMTGLSSVLSGVASESVLVRQSKDKGKDENKDEEEEKVTQTVIYRWSN